MAFKLELLIVASLFAIAYSASSLPSWKCTDSDWAKYKKEFEKEYESAEKELYHYNTYCDNIIMINQHNERYLAHDASYKLEINKYTDLNVEQASALLNKNRKKRPINRPPKIPVHQEEEDES